MHVAPGTPHVPAYNVLYGGMTTEQFITLGVDGEMKIGGHATAGGGLGGEGGGAGGDGGGGLGVDGLGGGGDS